MSGKTAENMPRDISEEVYRYLARDWGQSGDVLTLAKIRQLKRDIPNLRQRYQRELRIPYHQSAMRRAYLASFAARYAYILHGCLDLVRAKALATLQPWHRDEAVVCLMGGGPACELVGLLEWLYDNDIKPKYLHAVILDREGFWRSFHSFLFVEILGRLFPKTQIIPTYESVDFPVAKGKKFVRESVDYGFRNTSLLAEARLISLANCLSEIPNHRGFECQLRFLTRIAWNSQLVVCADSAAKKRRQRMSWLSSHFHSAAAFRARGLFSGVHTFGCSWLTSMSPNSVRIFNKATKPVWLHSFKRWIYVAHTRP